MTYRGHVRNGLIVLDPPAQLPEGSAVEVRPIGSDHDSTDTEASPPTLAERHAAFIGIAEGLPDDLAAQHDRTAVRAVRMRSNHYGTLRVSDFEEPPMSTQATPIKEEARRLVESLPDEATWDDLMHRIYVRQAIEAGLADSQAGRSRDVKDVRARFGLDP
jgi:hypothetical protein